MKQDNSSDIVQSFNVELPKTQSPPKKSQKKKYIIIGSIIFLSLAIITTVVLIIVYFSNKDAKPEIYQVTEIKRELYSEEYYTETKTIKSKLSYSSGELDEKVQKIQKQFMVMITDKEELPENIILNTATLIVLKSEIEMEGKQSPLYGFNISDEKVVDEFEKKPNSEKYPMAIFRFYENGTLFDINLPKEIDKQNAESIIELIDNIMPKLIRNRTEDKEKGVEINTRSDRKKKTFSVSGKGQRKNQILSNLGGLAKPSKSSYSVERDIENDKITEIRAKNNLYFETQKKENDTDYIDFGIKDFYYDTSSVINSTENTQKDVNYVNFIKRLTSKLEFVEGGKLLNSLLEKEKKELNKKVNETDGTEEEEKSPISEQQLRNLGWEGSFSYEWVIASSNILGQECDVLYSISLGGGEVENALILQFPYFSIFLGNTRGISSNSNKKKADTNEREIGRIPLASVAVTLSVNVGCSLNYKVSFSKDVFAITLDGSIYATAGVCLGWGKVASLEAGIKGNFISVEFTTEIERVNYKYRKKKISLTAKSGNISVYAKAKLLFVTLFSEEYEIWKGWKTFKITW